MFSLYADYYYIVMGLQGFCLYHAYKNNNQQKWFYIIIFLPLIGCLIYLYDNFYSRRKISNISEGVKGIVNSNRQIEKLEQKVKFSDTFNNKMSLGDAYFEKSRYEDAIKMYESCRTGFYQNNEELIQRLTDVFFAKRDFEKIIELYKITVPIGDSKVKYAWALHYQGQTEKAEKIFIELNKRFTNISARVEYAKFLIENGKPKDAQNLLSDIVEEYDSMSGYEKNLKRTAANEAKKLLKSI